MPSLNDIILIFYSSFLKLLFVLPLNELGNSLQLHVAGSFVDGTDLGVSEEFLLREVLGESNSTHEVYALGC